MDPTTVTQILGLSPEQTAALITIGALSTSFFFVWNFIKAPIDKALTAIENYFVREINLHISEPDYNKVNLWLDENEKYIKFQRSYKVVNSQGKSEESWDDEDSNKKTCNRLIAGFGTILVTAPGHPFMLIRREKEESKQIYQQTETLSIRFLTMKPERILKFFNEVTNIIENDGPYVWSNNGDWWSMRGIPKPVSKPVGEGARKMISSVERFINSREEYEKRKLPFKRGYLMHGEPGTGKTSILSYIAQQHGLHIYTMTSESILKMDRLTTNIKPNSMIIIEDIDLSVIGTGRSSIEGDEDNNDEGCLAKGMTNKDALNNFLNAIDGIVSFNATLIVATTNNPTILDSAMLRPGRIDECIEVGLLESDDQIAHISNFFDADVDPSKYELPRRTFAELQLICTSNMMDLNEALRCLQEERTNNKIVKRLS